jgi:predicted ribosomally synthesized peptide with SipW-like signal peptide
VKLQRLAVGLAVLVVAAIGAAAALAYFNSRDDSTVAPAGGPGTVRAAGSAPAVEPGNVLLQFSDERQTAGLRALALDTGGKATPALIAAGQAVIVQRRTGLRVPVIAYTSRRRLQADGHDDPRLRAFVEYWLGRDATG